MTVYLERWLLLRACMFTLTMADACAAGNLQFVRLLHQSTPCTLSAQIIAIKSGHLHLVEYFMDRGFGDPIWLLNAALHNQPHIVTHLLARGFAADADVLRASVYSKNVDIVAMIAARCAPTNHCLESAALLGELPIVRLFVDQYGLEVTPYAFAHARRDVLRYFVKELKLPVEEAVFEAAAVFGYTDNIRFLIEENITFPPLLLRRAARSGNQAIVQLLISKQLESVHEGDDYALRWAARMGHANVVKYLLSCGANVFACNNYAERWATRYGHTDIVHALKKAAKAKRAYASGVREGRRGQILPWRMKL